MKEAGDTGEHCLKARAGTGEPDHPGNRCRHRRGIFVLTGSAAALYAGPAIMLSYVLAGTGCVFAGLCYAEFASMIPIAGSAYTYGYATLGELIAWIIGWDLILEYAFGAATVASGWSSTLVAFLQDYGIRLPPQICDVPGALWVMVDGRWGPASTFNLPAEQTGGAAARHGQIQPDRVPGHPRGHHHPHYWHQRIRQLQHWHRIREAFCRADFHRPSRCPSF